MKKLPTLFLSSFCLFAFFLTPNINTGDAGDLITASHFLGTAHPSGYPLYLLILKTFSYLPIGNAAFKSALVSSLFSSLSVTLLYWIMLRITKSDAAAIFTSALLLSSYSFFTQSVITKFYPLNLFLILVVIAICVHQLLDDASGTQDQRALYLFSFVLGLTAANHHTGVIVALPALAVLWGRYLKKRNMKSCVTGSSVSMLLFLLGFMVNAYMIIRGWSGDFFNATKVMNLPDLYDVLTREAYNESGTLSVATHSLQGAMPYWYGLKNFVHAVSGNFGVLTFPLSMAGCFYLYRKNRKLLFFLFACLVLYGPFLARLTVCSPSMTEKEYYVIVHQYFLPAFAILAVLTGLGFYEGVCLFKKLPFRGIGRLIPFLIAIIPLTFIISRAADSNYRTNYIPYQATKDTLSIIPVDSVFLSFGDNATYQGWYIKLVGRYREDVGQLASTSNLHKTWKLEAFNKIIYGALFPSFYTQNFNAMKPLMRKGRFFATDPIQDDSPYKKYLNSSPYSLVNLYTPNDEPSERLYDFLKERTVSAERLVNPEVCLSHLTDDFFTRRICSRYTIHLAELARYLSSAPYGITGRTARVQLKNDETGSDMLLYTINVTKGNEPYLVKATQIQEYNKWEIFYLRK